MHKSGVRVCSARSVDAGSLDFDASDVGLPEAEANVLVKACRRPAANVEERGSRRIDVDMSKRSYQGELECKRLEPHASVGAGVIAVRTESPVVARIPLPLQFFLRHAHTSDERRRNFIKRPAPSGIYFSAASDLNFA